METEVKNLRQFTEELKYQFRITSPSAFAAYSIFDSNFLNIDHVAFRTFSYGKYSLDKLKNIILDMGYTFTGEYNFPDKHVRAESFSLQHKFKSNLIGLVPRIFLSEIRCHELSPKAQDIISEQVMDYEVDLKHTNPLGKFVRHGQHNTKYSELAEESEYAAWVYLNGLIPNHFTVSTTIDMNVLVDILAIKGYIASNFGSVIKGSPQQLLEQVSLVADKGMFTDRHGFSWSSAPKAYCEFARRYIDPKTDDLFDKFIESSANNIFHSTDTMINPTDSK